MRFRQLFHARDLDYRIGVLTTDFVNADPGRGPDDQRFFKEVRSVQLDAAGNPVLDARGRPFKVVKYATDVTQQKLLNADFAGQIAAIDKSQAVIAFAMDGTILSANENFLKALGYTQRHGKAAVPDGHEWVWCGRTSKYDK